MRGVTFWLASASLIGVLGTAGTAKGQADDAAERGAPRPGDSADVWLAAAEEGEGGSAGLWLDEIVVEATRGEREAATTPGAFNLIGREEIQFRQADDLEDVLEYEPGVDVEARPRGIGQEPNIRGLADERVLMTLDGARLNFDSGHKGRLFFEPEWLRRVEVVRGPNSALYGSGALGGSMHMRTVNASDFLEPAESFGFRKKIGFEGASEELSVTPMAFGQMGPKRGDGKRSFAYTLSYSGRFSDDIEIGNDGGELPNSGRQINAGLGKIAWRPTEEDTIRFTSINWHNEQEVPGNTAIRGGTTQDRTTLQSVLSLEYRHDDEELTWWNPRVNLHSTFLDVDERPIAGGQEDEISFDTYGIDVSNRHVYDWGEHGLRLTYGFEFFRDEEESQGGGAGGANVFFPDATKDHTSLYVQGEFSFFDELITVVPGARADFVETESDGGADSSNDEISPKVGAVVKLDDELNLAEGDFVAFSANYAEGFRTPSFQDLFIAGTHFRGSPMSPTGVFVPNPNLEPERSENVDLGVRTELGGASFSANYFQLEAEDFIDFDETPTNFTPPPMPRPTTVLFRPVNLNQVTIQGVELEAAYRFNPQWRLWANYTHTEGDSSPAGDPLTAIPPDETVVGLDYHNETWGLRIGPRVTYVDSKSVNTPGARNFNSNESYTVVDLHGTWRPKFDSSGLEWLNRLRVDFGIDNVTDDRFRPFLSGVPAQGINPRVALTYTHTW